MRRCTERAGDVTAMAELLMRSDEPRAMLEHCAALRAMGAITDLVEARFDVARAHLLAAAFTPTGNPQSPSRALTLLTFIADRRLVNLGDILTAHVVDRLRVDAGMAPYFQEPW